MVDTIAGVVISILVVAGITTLVLPGRETASVEREGFSGFAKVINASLGRG